MGKLITFAAVVVAAGVLVARWADQSGLTRSTPSAMAAAPGESPTGLSNSRAVTLPRGHDGHFRTEARVDGRRLELVVDTGASQIALRASDAARLGIHPAPRDYNVRVSTANGMTRAATVQLGMVEVGNIVVRDVPALIHPDEALGVNLLGMSFLSRVRWSYERGRLMIEQ
jgi:aspartyl protease family protein